MQFLEAVQTCVVKKYCDFSGRASRSEFWWYALAYLVVSYAWSFIVGLLTGGAVMMNTDGTFHFEAIQLLGYIPSLALLLPTLGVCVRRLHDVGKSGWWYFLNFVCCVGSLYLLYLYIQDSEGDNEYGPRPLK